MQVMGSVITFRFAGRVDFTPPVVLHSDRITSLLGKYMKLAFLL